MISPDTYLARRNRVEDLLKSGGYGSVMSAMDIKTGEMVAVKLVPLVDRDGTFDESGITGICALKISTVNPTQGHYYELLRNKRAEGEYQDVPRSGHFLFQAPRNYFIQFNTQPVQKFYGRHSELVLKIIKVTENNHEVNHTKIDKANENSKEIGTHLNDEELHTLHGH
ncbi:unnamed protein product [Caenorhabditis brenneri]